MPQPPSNYDIYGSATQNTETPREREAKALIKAANSMQGIVAEWESASEDDVKTVLEYNSTLWAMFYNQAEEGSITNPALKKNIISLGDFVFRRSAQIRNVSDRGQQKTMFDILININRQIAGGLFSAK